MLLNAQREEGVRQHILEWVPYASPQVFPRFIKLILDNNLLRFSSVVRCVDVWFGLQWDSYGPKPVQHALELAHQMLTDPDARAQALDGDAWEPWFYAAWASCFEDAPASAELLGRGLESDVVEIRYCAARILYRTHSSVANRFIPKIVVDRDPRVAQIGLNRLHWRYGHKCG